MNLLNSIKMNKLSIGILLLFICSCSKEVRIASIQNHKSDLTDSYISVKGIVSGDFQETGELAGFYLQDERLFSTRGIFVHSKRKVNLGDEILISAKVIEYKNETRLDSVSSITTLSTNNSFSTQTLSFPYSPQSIEQLEGCLVNIDEPMYISDSYSYEKYGQLLVSMKPMVQATEIYDAQKESDEIEKHNFQQLYSSIVVDDLSNKRNPLDEDLYLPKDAVVVGSKVKNIKGYLSQRNDKYSIRLASDLEYINIKKDHDTSLLGDLKIMSFNLHNLFNGDGNKEGFPTERGAKDYQSYQKQIQKLAAAIDLANPDIIALMEVENDGEHSLSAIAQFCEYLNTITNRTSYTVAKTVGLASKDVIKNGVIYDSLKVKTAELGNYYPAKIFSRSPLFQSFTFKDSLDFVLSVNHFKSKSPRNAKGENVDQLDGQAAFNTKRTQQAKKLLQLVDSLYASMDLLIVGDFNAYTKEDPIQAIESAKLIRLESSNYSYIYKGNMGCLDHAFATNNFEKQIKQIQVLDINASYPNWMDYRFENSDSSYFRSSDHNPIIIGVY